MNSLRNTLGLGRSKRYHTGEYRELDEISDPSTTEDETTISARDWISENTFLVITVFLAGIVALAVVGNWAIAFIPSIVTNIWFQRIVVLVTAMGSAYVMGIKNHATTMRNVDWLVLVKSNGVQWYPGHFMHPDDGDAPLFIPIRGFTMLEHQANPYTIEDFSRELVRMHSGAKKDPKDPVVIRLHPEFAVSMSTDYGNVVAQLSEGLDMDESGVESNLVALLPDLADDDAIDALRSKLEELTEELRDEQAKSQMLKRQRNLAREEAQKNEQEIIKKYSDYFLKMSQGESMMGGGMGGGFEQPWDTEEEFADEEVVDIEEEIEEELGDEE